MQGGILINGRNPKSKKQVKEAVASAPDTVEFYDTSARSNFSAQVKDLPAGTHVFVGPNPYNSRKFYGNVSAVDGKVKVS